MIFKFPKNDKNFHWTQHIKDKMLFYRLSEQKIKPILKSPDRREEGIAPNTIAVMKRNDTKKRQEEIWIMYADASSPKKSKPPKPHTLVASSSKLIMISAWRYPGKSRAGKAIPIPEDILEDVLSEIKKAAY